MPKKINIKKTSLLDELQNIQQETVEHVVIAPSIQQTMEQQFVKQAKTKDVNIGSLLSNIKNKEEVNVVESTEPQQIVDTNDIDVVINKGQIIVSDDVDTEDLAEDLIEVVDAIEHIPDVEIADIQNIEITKRKKGGYVKNKVTINSKIFSAELSRLASEVKQKSGGAIRHRKCDLRSISNTNKSQLKTSDVKLYSETYTIKPVGGVVNKATRIMLSMDVNTDNHILVYFQTSRAKFIHKFDISDEADFEWLSEWIVDFYVIKNFDASKHRILNRSYSENPLFKVIRNIAGTKNYRVALPKNTGNEITRFSFVSLYGEKTHARFSVVRDRKTIMSPVTMYNIYLTSDIDPKLHVSLKNSAGHTQFSIEQIKSDNFLDVIETFLEGYDNSGNELVDIAYNKLKHNKVKKALTYIINVEDSEELGIEIVKVLNADDTIRELVNAGKSPKADYDSENIVIKSNHVDYAIIQFMGIQEIGGSVRGDKKYNSRVYKFKIIYSVDGIQQTPVIHKTFTGAADLSGILTNKPKIQ